MTPAEELRAAADALWDRAPDPVAEPLSIEHQPRSWSVALGQLAWELELANVRPLAEPVPCRGALGLWRLPEDVDAAVRSQLEERAA